MKTTKNEGFVLTQFSSADRKAFKLIIELLSPLVELQTLGRYSTMSADEVWLTLVEQASVMGSARPIERLASDCGKYRKFKEAVSLSAVTSQPNPTTYVSQTLKEFSATRFYRRAADKLVAYWGRRTCLKAEGFCFWRVYLIRTTLLKHEMISSDVVPFFISKVLLIL